MNLHLGLSTMRRIALASVCRRRARVLSERPIISFTFDDFSRSAWEVGGSLLEKYGAHGTYYVAMSLEDTQNHLGELFQKEDLLSLLARGHELGSHTFDHLSAKTSSPKEFWENVEQGKAALHDRTKVTPRNFAYPFGDLTTRIKRATHGVKSVRSIFPGLNHRIFDLNLLRANSLYGDVDVLSRARKLIAQNVEKCEWLIFYTHDVRQVPSHYGCTPELLEQVIQESVQSGARLLSVQEALGLCEELPRE